MTSSAELRATILGQIDARRDGGKITSGFLSHAGPGATADRATAIAQSKGFAPPTSGWRTIERPEALRILEKILGQDLAHDTPMMSSPEAHELAFAFLNLIPDVCAYVTNGTWGQDTETFNAAVKRGASWDPISSATFDTGVICVGLEESALLWVEDED